MPTLHLHDFDDTLARSLSAVQIMEAVAPEVPFGAWWHDPELAKSALSITQPRYHNWDRIDRASGVHLILTGRNGAAVEDWLKQHRDDPDIGRAVRKIHKVISVSPTSMPWTKGIGVTRAKSMVVRDIKKVWDGPIRFYDDDPENIAEMRRSHPEVKSFLIEPARVRNPKQPESDPERFNWLSLAQVRKALPEMDKRGVSKVARSARGFIPAYKRAKGRWKRLGESSGPWEGRHWVDVRNGFVARHMGQVRENNEPLWEKHKGEWRPTRRHLALIAWAYTPSPKRLQKYLRKG